MSSTIALRQIGLLVGLGASIVIGAAVVLWLWIPSDSNYFGEQLSHSYGTPVNHEGYFVDAPHQALQSSYRDKRINLVGTDSESDFNGKYTTNGGAQLEYTQKLEATFTNRIERLLEPLLGVGALRAQVTADIDFTSREETLETYKPDTLVLRNNELEEQVNNHEDGEKPVVKNKHRREVNSYELDKTINRTRSAVGRIEKLSIAVIVDDKLTRGVKGNVIRTPHSADELSELADLVKKTVGFKAKRGDVVNVIGASFKTRQLSNQPLYNNVSIKPTWSQVWVKDLFNKTLGTLLVLLIIFAVIRPAMKSLVSLPVGEGPYNGHSGGVGVNSNDGLPEKSGTGDYEKNLDVATKVVENDPKLVAQIMKNWVVSDGT